MEWLLKVPFAAAEEVLSEWLIKIPLAILGVIELIVRAVILLVLTLCTLMFFLMLLDDRGELGDFLKPWCFKYLQERERQQAKTTQLSYKQRRQLAFEHEKLAIEERRRDVLRETLRLENELQGAPVALGK